MSVPFAAFGPGSLYLTRTDVANATPINIGYVNEFALDIAYTKKELYGQDIFPLQTARATAKLTGKAKAAVVSGIALNSAIFGQSFTTGSRKFIYQEQDSVPATTTYTITVAQAATFDADLGVLYGLTNLPLQKVASGPAAGQYSVNASTGVYTFASADANAAVLISYTYLSSMVGQTLVINNQLIGTTPTFQLDYATNNQGSQMCIRAYSCIGDKLSLAYKLEDFMMPALDFDIYANSTGKVFSFSFPEVS